MKLKLIKMNQGTFWISLLLLTGTECQECNTSEGWEEYENKCYYASLEHKTWHAAYEYCRQNGGHLTSVHSMQEMDFIFNMTTNNGERTWLGGHDLDYRNGSFKWTDGGGITWSDWAPSQPDSTQEQYCLYTGSTMEKISQESKNTGTCTMTRQEGISRMEGVVEDPKSAPAGCKRFGYIPSDGVNICEQRCENDELCDVYTYMAKHEDVIYAWQGECVFCNFTMSGDKVPITHATSGEKLCGEDGVDMWYTANCGLQMNFVCSKVKGSSTPLEPTPKTPNPGYCPSEWIDAGHKCFKIVNLGSSNGVTKDVAKDYCLDENGRFPNLASLSTPEETAVLVTAIRDYAYGVWVGLSKIGDHWLWADNGDTAFQNWSPSRPDEHSCVELVVSPPGTWADLDCDSKRGYICEVYKDSNNPLSTPSTTPHNCLAGYMPYWYACYKLDQQQQGWQSAEQECEQDGGHLVSIHTAAENSAIWYLVQTSGGSFPVWIGFKQNVNDEFEWSDGWWVRYTNWNADRVPVYDNPICAYMNSKGEWEASSCSEQYATVCKMTSVPAITPPVNIPGTCPDDWIEYGNNCYHIVESPTALENWEDASAKCQEEAIGFHISLASIHDHVTNQFLADQLSSVAWIGLSKAGQGELYNYTWNDGSEANFFRWAPDEPKDEISTQTCVLMASKNDQFPGTWSDDSCSNTYGYICQTVKNGVPPTNDITLTEAALPTDAQTQPDDSTHDQTPTDTQTETDAPIPTASPTQTTDAKARSDSNTATTDLIPTDGLNYTDSLNDTDVLSTVGATEDPGDEDEGLSIGVIIGIAVAAVVIVAAIGALIYKKRSRSSDDDQWEDDEEEISDYGHKGKNDSSELSPKINHNELRPKDETSLKIVDDSAVDTSF